ncbi:MAG: nucleotidyltransferase domain-containing protein [Candidatus Edwardsbacteria bacterium]|nr:nucleotidyltransferase domain-containing protein [Candidatus Edwardsbacteria bacterium]
MAAMAQNGASIDQIVLFGSHAKRAASAVSDIDLLIVSPYFERKTIFQRQAFLGKIKWKIGQPIDPLGYTKKEFAGSISGTFLSEIKRTGKIVYRGK